MSDFNRRIIELLQSRIEAGAMSAAAVRIERGDELVLEWAGGRLGFDPDTAALTPDSVFLIASIAKPMACAAVAKLIERGLVDLDDRVADYVPEFAANGKEEIRLRHCLTHTSGLPDMLPDNEELRKANAPLEAFVASACRTHLLFPPGTDVRYQSSGILMLAEVVERVTGDRFRDFLAGEVLRPAGMADTHLGWRADFDGRRVEAKVENPEATADWNHNSPYWCDLGSPWGGVHSTVGDVARFLRLMLNGGATPEGWRVFQPGTVRLMLADHTSGLPDLPAAARLREGWGLGWRIPRLGDEGWFGSAVPPGAFGHAGSTGTVAWADPISGTAFVLLTNGLLDAEGGTLKACGNIAACALCGAV